MLIPAEDRWLAEVADGKQIFNHPVYFLSLFSADEIDTMLEFDVTSINKLFKQMGIEL